MSTGFHTFDDARSLVRARAQMRHSLMAFAIVSLLVAAAAPLLAIWATGAIWVPLVAAGFLSLHAFLCIRSLSRHRQHIWRVAVSHRHIVALDVGRRQRTIAWTAVDRIDVSRNGLSLFARGLGGEPVRLRVNADFDSYVSLAHWLVALSERRGVSLSVEGRPWQQLPISGLIDPVRADVAKPTR